MINRRQFIKSTAQIATAGFLLPSDISSVKNLTNVTNYSFFSAAYPKNYPDLRIGFLSDFHWGCSSMCSADNILPIVQQTNQLELDLIILGGDFVDQKKFGIFQLRPFEGNLDPAYLLRDETPKIDDIAHHLSGLKAKLGVFAGLGNHDWLVDGDGMYNALNNRGIVTLENEIKQVEIAPNQPIQIIGLPDARERGQLFVKTPFSELQNNPTIFISHCPVGSAYITKWHSNHQDVAGLQLSGHTHGGQFTICGYAPHLPAYSGPQDKKYGQYWEYNTNVIVTSGLGTSGLPLRNVPPEIVVVTMGHRP